jgi:hypothetical protein
MSVVRVVQVDKETRSESSERSSMLYSALTLFELLKRVATRTATTRSRETTIETFFILIRFSNELG